LDIKRILNGRKRKGEIALLPNQSPAGFAEISMRDYENGCCAQPVPFLEGIWIKKPYRPQGVGFALVKTIKRDLHEQVFTELCSSAHIENTVSHSAHQSWGFDETDRVVFFRASLV
jgi:aminoglycoside 6'-N-acetyltransferase I